MKNKDFNGLCGFEEEYSLLQRLSFSSPEKCKKLCVKAVNAAITDVCGAVTLSKKEKRAEK